MKLSVSIKSHNAAIDGNPKEVIRILSDLIRAIKGGINLGGVGLGSRVISGNAYDINGNKVGTFHYDAGHISDD